jgi:hypothetical protein
VLDHALPQAMMRRGRLVLHASCLATSDNRCFALAGESGRGKSTLAAALVERGYRLVSDDCAVVELGPGRPRVVPAYPGLRLHRTSLRLTSLDAWQPAGAVADEGGKLRFSLPDLACWDGRRASDLDAVVLLAPNPVDTVDGLRRLGSAEAVIALLRHSFHVNDASERIDLVGRMATLVEGIEALETHYEHSIAGLATALDGLHQRFPLSP